MKNTHALLTIGIVLVVTLVLYVGAYLALLLPPPQAYNDYLARRWSNYRYGGRIVEWAFWPLEQIDRKLRPQKWDWEELSHPDGGSNKQELPDLTSSR
jgi:hypothetical protein